MPSQRFAVQKRNRRHDVDRASATGRHGKNATRDQVDCEDCADLLRSAPMDGYADYVYRADV